MYIQYLTQDFVEDIIHLQTLAIANKDPFTPSSRELYLRAFQFQNFIQGVFEDNHLIGYCNCSIPTSKSIMNLGRDIVANAELDNVGHVNTILISPQYRRRGFGNLLLNSSIECFSKNPQIKYVFTTIQTNNIASYELFLKNDFYSLKTFENKGQQKYLLEKIMS